ncbi:hypothetical protein FBU30_000114 [Linnemannia zychae]|nr:hypothetical protein FBU30_000114 [Linnemannia zychae]
MAEEAQREYEEEFYDENDNQEYNEEDEDVDCDHYEQNDENGDIQVGQEIDLTHEEVWDDSALIEAWDMAVKQYEAYHSKTNPMNYSKDTQRDKSKKSSSIVSPNKHKNTDSTPQAPNSSTKRTKPDYSNESTSEAQNRLSGPNELNRSTGTQSQTIRSEPDSSLTTTAIQTQPIQRMDQQYDVSDRKPSFKKANKPSFNHYREHREEVEKEKAKRAKNTTSISQLNSSTEANTTLASAPVVDAATIAYYQQLGYYYDPNYAAAAYSSGNTLLTEELEQNDEEDDHGRKYDRSSKESEVAGNNMPSESARTSHNSGTINDKMNATRSARSTTSRAANKNRAPYPMLNSYGLGSAMYHPTHPLYPSPHGIYPGYFASHPPPAPPSFISPRVPPPADATAAAGVGGFGFSTVSGMPGVMSPGWNAFGAQAPSFGSAPPPAGAHGMMPPPPIPPFPPSSGGSISGQKMDDEALGNLIMAWYFSGYYTGLYQAQRR